MEQSENTHGKNTEIKMIFISGWTWQAVNLNTSPKDNLWDPVQHEIARFLI